MKQEQLDKLKQLDRIEYRLMKKDIDENYPRNNLISFIKMALFVTIFITSMCILLVFIDAEASIQAVYSLMDAVRIIIIVCIVGGFLCDAIEVCLNNYKTKKLNQRFFNFKLEVKK